MSNPGLPDVPPPLTDLGAEARRRARRRAAGMFTLGTVLAVVAIAVTLGFSIEIGGRGVDVSHVQRSNLGLGLPLGLALLLLGAGTVYWSRTLTSSTEIVEQRVPRGDGGSGAGNTRLPRRRLIRYSLAGGLALLPVAAVVGLRGLDPAPAGRRERTAWAGGVRLLTDITYRPIRVADLEVGELVNVVPASLLELPEDGPARLNERARSPVVLVRMRPHEIAPHEGRENWHVDGVVAYSKICTHVGCPVSLYERTTHHLLCPCHQATFDLAAGGAVVFGPATRPLPQLPLRVDDDGYLVAQSEFTEPVGPSYWEREG